MIYDLPDTTTGAVNKKIIEIRESGGAVALGRVLTLIIVTDEGPAELAIRAANDASREHPCRVIAVVRGNRRGANRLDAQLRVGGDAGASEVIVLRLYGQLADHGDSVIVPFLLPDAPIVAWWPGDGPELPAEDPIGRMAQRRITDSAAARNPIKSLHQRAHAGHVPGDTDLAWSRITLWRGLLAATLDEAPYEPVTAATVEGGSDSPSTEVMAAWLRLFLDCPVKRVRTAAGTGMIAVGLERASGTIELRRPDGNVATLVQPGQPERRIALAPRADRDCITEELRRLDPDDVFTEVVTRGLPLLTGNGGAVPTGKLPARSAIKATKPPEAPTGQAAAKTTAAKSTAAKGTAAKSTAAKSTATKGTAAKATAPTAAKAAKATATPAKAAAPASKTAKAAAKTTGPAAKGTAKAARSAGGAAKTTKAARGRATARREETGA